MIFVEDTLVAVFFLFFVVSYHMNPMNMPLQLVYYIVRLHRQDHHHTLNELSVSCRIHKSSPAESITYLKFTRLKHAHKSQGIQHLSNFLCK